MQPVCLMRTRFRLGAHAAVLSVQRTHTKYRRLADSPPETHRLHGSLSPCLCSCKAARDSQVLGVLSSERRRYVIWFGSGIQTQCGLHGSHPEPEFLRKGFRDCNNYSIEMVLRKHNFVPIRVSCRRRFLRPHCGEGLGLQTSPVSLLQTVGEPSVLGARTLCPYVPLRAKPKRKRVCKRDTGARHSSLRSRRSPLPGSTSA